MCFSLWQDNVYSLPLLLSSSVSGSLSLMIRSNAAAHSELRPCISRSTYTTPPLDHHETGLRKPQLDGDLRRIRSGGGTGVCVCVYCHDLDWSHAINDVTKKNLDHHDFIKYSTPKRYRKKREEGEERQRNSSVTVTSSGCTIPSH